MVLKITTRGVPLTKLQIYENQKKGVVRMSSDTVISPFEQARLEAFKLAKTWTYPVRLFSPLCSGSEVVSWKVAIPPFLNAPCHCYRVGKAT